MAIGKWGKMGEKMASVKTIDRSNRICPVKLIAMKYINHRRATDINRPRQSYGRIEDFPCGEIILGEGQACALSHVLVSSDLVCEGIEND